MAAYMRDQFPFFGIQAAPRRSLTRTALGDWTPGDERELLEAADALWAEPERELQYVATDLLSRHHRLLGPDALPRLERLVTTKSWWDTVDALAAHPIGAVVLAHSALWSRMDELIDSADFWLARTAILHQLRFKEATDAERLFSYCRRRAADEEFFLRKAIGWALRQYAHTDPAAVRSFLAEHGDELSPLSVREASKHL
jgi:3-methyladenine DNA glycosylase AlkD